MRIAVLVATTMLLTASSIASAECPGNVLTGEHRPRGGAEKWFWTLDAKDGVARIQKPGTEVHGKVSMICDRNKWSAHLFEMSHQVVYNCNGDIDDNAIRNGVCTASVPPVIDVTGTFTTKR